MQNLSPPTDNLYKFIGVSGLIMTIACGAALFLLINQNLDRLDKPSIEAHQVVAEREQIKERRSRYTAELARLDKQIDDTLLKVKSGTLTKESLVRYERRHKEIASNLDSLDTLDTDLARRTATVNAEKEIFNTRIKWAGEQAQPVTVGLILSLALMFTGFGLWFERSQKYLDMVTKADGLKAQREMEERLATPAATKEPVSEQSCQSEDVQSVSATVPEAAPVTIETSPAEPVAQVVLSRRK